MMKYFTFAFLAVLFFVGNASAQTKSATGNLVSMEGGNHQGTVCLRIKGKTLCLDWGDQEWGGNTTKFNGFKNGKAWEIGAVWRITYRYDKCCENPQLKSATFTGRILK